MWQSWQNKILREAAKFGYKSGAAEFYEQELSEDYKKVSIKGFQFWPFMAGRMSGWNVYYSDPKESIPIGYIEKGTHTKSSSVPSKLRVAGSSPTDYDKLVLNYWHPKSGYKPNGLNPSVSNLMGPPAKMLDAIAQWMIDNPTKWKYKK